MLGLYPASDSGILIGAVVCAGAAASVGSTCWKNSPQARKAVEAAVAAARSSLEAA